MGTAFDDGIMAISGVIGAICSDAGNALIGRDMGGSVVAKGLSPSPDVGLRGPDHIWIKPDRQGTGAP